MSEHIFLNTCADGAEILGFYHLAEAAIKKTSAGGKPYLTGKLSDMSASLDFKMWDYSENINESNVGSVVKIQGRVSMYKGTPQVTVEKIRLAVASDQYDMDTLIPVAPINAVEAEKRLLALLDSISDPDYRKMAVKLYERHKDTLYTIPAAKSVHHGFVHGLLMHTCNMMQLADAIYDIYRGTINRDLLLAGTFAHDLLKEREYEYTPIGTVKDYSVPGQLLGHLVMGAMEIDKIAKELNLNEEKSILLQHMLLSHHGKPEYGAAVSPMCAEAEVLFYIDMIDSRMEIYREAYENTNAGEMSDRVFALSHRVYKSNFMEPAP